MLKQEFKCNLYHLTQDLIKKFSNNSHNSDHENTWCLLHSSFTLIFINTKESANIPNNNKVCVRKSSRRREEHIRNSYDKWAINCCLLFDSGWSRCPTVRGRFRTTILAVMEFHALIIPSWRAWQKDIYVLKIRLNLFEISNRVLKFET